MSPGGPDRATLEAERDFLMRSLDDLEAERATGNVDEASYRALRDDYTARAASVIRALRDGVATTSEPASKRRNQALVLGALGIVGLLAVGTLVLTLTDRLPGQTSSGNSASDQNLSVKQRITRLQTLVRSDPNDVPSRLLLAQLLEARGDLAGALEQYDAALAVAPTNTQALAHSGRVLYIAAQAVAGAAADQLIGRSRERLDRAIAVDGGFVEARYYRAIVLAFEYQDYKGAQADLQRYLLVAPDGPFANDARKLLADVTKALEPSSTTTTRSP